MARWIVTGARRACPACRSATTGTNARGLALELGTPTLRLSALATDLQDEIDSLGQTVHRYYFLHRLQARFSSRLSLALWEGVVLAGADRNFETRYRNPLSLNYLASTIGLGDRGNVLLGVDARWRAFGRTTFNVQFALDDFWYQNRRAEPRPLGLHRSARKDRWVAQQRGTRCIPRCRASRCGRSIRMRTSPMPASASAGTSATTTSSLSGSRCPFRTRWLLSPELTLLRQGEGEINDPYPVPDANGVLSTPALFIGVVERTYRAAVGLTGGTGPLELDRRGGLPPRGQRRASSGPDRGSLRRPTSGYAGFLPERSASMRQSPPPLTRDRVLQLIQRMKSSRVVVVGDIMLDRYLIGETERLSPEAPVPVVTVRERHAALGGAANVAANVIALGARCLLVGAVGDDADGAAIRQELAVARLEDRHVLTIAGRPTTSKTRIIARSQQIVRIDDEVDTLLEGPTWPG